MKLSKSHSTTFFNKIGIYYDCEIKTIVIMFKEKRWYLSF